MSDVRDRRGWRARADRGGSTARRAA